MKNGISLHWTAGQYIASLHDKASYHGGVQVIDGNAVYSKWHDYNDHIGHTWRRNTDLIGLTICAMGGVYTNKSWEIPPTKAQLDSLCLAAAEVAVLKGIDLQQIKTHGEWAVIDGYGPLSGDSQTRWDLTLFAPGNATPQTAKMCGDELRSKIKKYMLEIKDGKREIRRELHFQIGR